jgi:anti-anti-sigma factor
VSVHEHHPQGLSITIAALDDRVAVALAGEMDLANVDQFRDALTATWRTPNRDVAIDLSALTFIDSSGLRALVEFHRQAAEERRDYKLVGAAGSVRRTLEISGLDQVLVLDETGS